jgi:2-polyprenyl-6-methoxyphenol hydroxylase-like FAD-dependent oxidoreductase
MIQPANALRALSSIGLLDRCLEAGFASDERRYFDAAGRELVAYTSGRAAGREFPAANCLPRPALHAILKEAAKRAGANLTLGTTAIEMTRTPDGMEVQLSDGRRRGYDLVVGADGIRSLVREQQLGGRREPDFTGYGCWRVSLPRPPEITYHGIYQGINGTKAGLVPLTRETMYLYLVTNEPGNPWIAPERARRRSTRRRRGGQGAHWRRRRCWASEKRPGRAVAPGPGPVARPSPECKDLKKREEDSVAREKHGVHRPHPSAGYDNAISPPRRHPRSSMGVDGR